MLCFVIHTGMHQYGSTEEHNPLLSEPVNSTKSIEEVAPLFHHVDSLKLYFV